MLQLVTNPSLAVHTHIVSSVTILGKFQKFIATKFLTKVAPIFYHFLGFLKTRSF